MKNRFKVSIWFIVAGVIASLVSAGSVLADDSFRVEAQCYQFIADHQPDSCANAKSSIWVVESRGGRGEPCAVNVWAEYGDELTCQNFQKREGRGSNKITGHPFSALNIIIGPEPTIGTKGEKLSDPKTTNSACDEMWLRFTDNNDCNLRCFYTGGGVFYM